MRFLIGDMFKSWNVKSPNKASIVYKHGNYFKIQKISLKYKVGVWVVSITRYKNVQTCNLWEKQPYISRSHLYQNLIYIANIFVNYL